jgi:hypothetical protein
MTRSHTNWGHINTTTSAEAYQILNKITYILSTHCHQISSGLSNAQQDHLLAKHTLKPPHQQRSVKYLTKSHTNWGNIDTTTSAEVIKHSTRSHTFSGWMHIDTTTSAEVYQHNNLKITYILGTHWHHHISKGSIRYSGSHTSWGHIDTTTSAEVYQIFNQITYILRTHWCHHISRDLSNTQWDHTPTEHTLTPPHQQKFIKYSMRLLTC